MDHLDTFTDRVRHCTERLRLYGVDALGALFDLTSQRLVRLAMALTGNQHDAEDAVQGSLVRLARQPALLLGANCPWAYLLRMVRNEAFAIARRKQRCIITADLSDVATNGRMATHGCVDILEQQESHRAVWGAIRTLPPEQAEVVVLKIWEECTFAQIGEILEISPHTAASRYQYAIGKLTQSLVKQREVLQ